MGFAGVRASTQRIGGRTARRGPERCRRKFLEYFPAGFRDATFVDWERAYKWNAHQTWRQELGPLEFRTLLEAGEYAEICHRAVRIESRTNLLFSFEKMALRDAVRGAAGARRFAPALFDLLHGSGTVRARFERWIAALAELPRRKTRVLSWPLATVFGFIAQPRIHLFLKPNVTRVAACRYGFDFHYRPQPGWEPYASLLAFGERVRADLYDLEPADMIDIQSFIWVQGSDEYPDRR